jgi:hypothetical protein
MFFVKNILLTNQTVPCAGQTLHKTTHPETNRFDGAGTECNDGKEFEANAPGALFFPRVGKRKHGGGGRKK